LDSMAKAYFGGF